MISFFAAGKVVPQGSARAMINSKTGRAVLIQSRRTALNQWRDDVRAAARDACVPYIESGPVFVSLMFRMPRPKSVPKDRQGCPTVAPDIDKAIRSCLDALTSVAYKDDAQVVKIIASKWYCQPGEQPGVEVSIEVLG